MKKSNQKGFMLAEAFIVSTFVLGVLVFMFVQIKSIINGFDKSFTYNTVSNIYKTEEIGKYIKANDYSNIISIVDINQYLILDDSSNYLPGNTSWHNLKENAKVKTIIISKENAEELKKTTNTDEKISNKLRNFIKYLKVDNSTSQYRIIIEFTDDTFGSIKL